MERFKDRIVYVTGAGSGVGRATAALFAAEGAKVFAVDVNQDGLDETVGAIRASVANPDASMRANSPDATTRSGTRGSDEPLSPGVAPNECTMSFASSCKSRAFPRCVSSNRSRRSTGSMDCSSVQATSPPHWAIWEIPTTRKCALRSKMPDAASARPARLPAFSLPSRQTRAIGSSKDSPSWP